MPAAVLSTLFIMKFFADKQLLLTAWFLNHTLLRLILCPCLNVERSWNKKPIRADFQRYIRINAEILNMDRICAHFKCIPLLSANIVIGNKIRTTRSEWDMNKLSSGAGWHGNNAITKEFSWQSSAKDLARCMKNDCLWSSLYSKRIASTDRYINK